MDVRDMINKQTSDKRVWRDSVKKFADREEDIVWKNLNKVYDMYKSLIGSNDNAESFKTLCKLNKVLCILDNKIKKVSEVIGIEPIESVFGNDSIVAFLKDNDNVTDGHTVSSHMYIAKELIQKIQESVMQDIRKLSK